MYISREKVEKIMKVKINKLFHISIEDMEPHETMAFIKMVRGAALEERRIFYGVLKDLENTPIDKLEWRED